MKFTIFSGCYNSASFIKRLFTSVCNQTYKDFEWFIYDDDSKDNTVDLIEKFITEHPEIDVKFVKNKPNKGIKHSYLETIKNAKGAYLVQWDHDDLHKSNELEVFNKIISEFDDGNLAGVWALCEDQNGNLLGSKYPEEVSVGNYFTHFIKYITKYGNNVKYNERMPCINISKMRELNKYVQEKYPKDYDNLYPTFRWALLSALENKIVFVNQVVRTYYIQQEHGSMSDRWSISNSRSLTVSNKYWINEFFKYLGKDSTSFKFSIYKSYVYHCILSNQPLYQIFGGIKNGCGKMIVLFLFLPVNFVARVKKRGKNFTSYK